MAVLRIHLHQTHNLQDNCKTETWPTRMSPCTCHCHGPTVVTCWQISPWLWIGDARLTVSIGYPICSAKLLTFHDALHRLLPNPLSQGTRIESQHQRWRIGDSYSLHAEVLVLTALYLRRDVHDCSWKQGETALAENCTLAARLHESMLLNLCPMCSSMKYFLLIHFGDAS